MIKHEKLIRVALEGKKIQYSPNGHDFWYTFLNQETAIEYLAGKPECYFYREEPPPPPPDIVTYINLYGPGRTPGGQHFSVADCDKAIAHGRSCILRLTYKHGVTIPHKTEVICV